MDSKVYIQQSHPIIIQKHVTWEIVLGTAWRNSSGLGLEWLVHTDTSGNQDSGGWCCALTFCLALGIFTLFNQ